MGAQDEMRHISSPIFVFVFVSVRPLLTHFILASSPFTPALSQYATQHTSNRRPIQRCPSLSPQTSLLSSFFFRPRRIPQSLGQTSDRYDMYSFFVSLALFLLDKCTLSFSRLLIVSLRETVHAPFLDRLAPGTMPRLASFPILFVQVCHSNLQTPNLSARPSSAVKWAWNSIAACVLASQLLTPPSSSH